MEIALIIVGGIVLTTLIAVVGDSITKAKQAQAPSGPLVQELTQKIAALEGRLADQESKILLLEENVSFTTQLLEDKSEKPRPSSGPSR